MRTADDYAAARNYWRFKNFEQIKNILDRSQSARSHDADLTKPLESILALTALPKEATPLEIEVLLALVGTNRIAELLGTQYGVAVIASLIARPTLEAKWDSSQSATMLKHIKGKPDGKLLRSMLVHIDAPSRKACKAAVQEVWDEGDVAVHQELAYSFFFEEDWREQALAEILDQAPEFSSAQLTLAKDEATIRTLLTRRQKPQPLEYTEIVAALGDGALDLLLELARDVRGTDPHMSHTLAMSVFVCEPAAHHLAESLSHPSTRGFVNDYFDRHRDLAKVALPKASQGASRNAALAKALMLKLCGPAVHAVDDGVPLHDRAVPEVLRDAPWRQPAAVFPNFEIDLAAWPVKVELSEKSIAEGLAWLESQRGGSPDMTPEEAVAFMANAGEAVIWQFNQNGKCVPLDLAMRLFNTQRWSAGAHVMMLAKFGVAVMPGIRGSLQLIRQMSSDVADAIDDPFFAYPFAASVIDAGRSGTAARASWFAKHPRAAATGLLAVLHEPDKAAIAAVVLRRLARSGHRATILEVAAATKHEAAVRTLLDRDPRLDVLPGTKGNVESAARPKLRDGRTLGAPVVERIAEMLAFSPVDEPYVGLADVKAACDPRSLAEMAWDLAALADGGGRHSSSRQFPDWMRWSLRHFADDEVIRRITPALKHNTMYAVLSALARDGVRSATIELATAQERGDVAGALEAVARGLGSSVDELVESMLPTTQLEAEGTTSLAFGSRTLRVGFDTTLAPILFLAEKRLASLPRAKADDDPIAIRLAREHWEELKEDVRAIAHLRCRGLERAMRSGRKISSAQFMSGWAHHPLGKHQARGMVWAVEHGAALVTFRVAEDSTLADIDDQALVLGARDIVRVPHPAELDPKVVDRWSHVLTDYGLIQCVQQLGRTPIAITPEELESTRVVRAIVPPVPSTVYRRIMDEQDFPWKRNLVRCAGVAQLSEDTEWTQGKRRTKQITLEFLVDGTKVPLKSIEPVELADALFVVRLATEAT